jgi:RNA polymerase sigma-70 factor, ECF subfamily
MDQQEWLARQFEEHRPHLRAVAYRMLGSLSEADDALQDAWLRLRRADTREVENLRAWLTTIVARVALNVLRARKIRREQPLDVHVPDPIVDPADGIDPEHEALLADSVGLALLVVLETLSPAERLAFVLHDMFGVPFEEIAPIVERSPEAARQVASRARRRVRGAPLPDADLAASGRSSKPSSPPPGMVTSARSSPCSTPTSCSAATPASPTSPGASRARRPSPARRSTGRRSA